MESLSSYLTVKGWKKDWDQTKENFKYFFKKGRRPIINGIEEPSKLEIALYEEGQKKGIIGKIAEVYFRPKAFEKSCRLYEMLGVRVFQKLVMGTIGNLAKLFKGHRTGSSFNYFVSQIDRNLKRLKRFESVGTRFNELVHTPLTYLTGYTAFEEFSRGDIEGGLYYVGFSLANAYCTMLQRYNRARVYNTIEQKLESAEQKKLTRKTDTSTNGVESIVVTYNLSEK